MFMSDANRRLRLRRLYANRWHVVIPTVQTVCVSWFPIRKEGAADPDSFYPTWVFDKLARPDPLLRESFIKAVLSPKLAKLRQCTVSSGIRHLPLEVFDQILSLLDEISVAALAIAFPGLIDRIQFRIENDLKWDCHQWAGQPLACLEKRTRSLPPQFEKDLNVYESLPSPSPSTDGLGFSEFNSYRPASSFKQQAVENYSGVKKAVSSPGDGIQKVDCTEVSAHQAWVNVVERIKRRWLGTELDASQLTTLQLLSWIARGDFIYGLDSKPDESSVSAITGYGSSVWYLRNLDKNEYVRIVRYFGYMDTVFDVMGNSKFITPCHLAWISKSDSDLARTIPHCHWVVDAPKMSKKQKITLFNKTMRLSFDRLRRYPEEHDRRSYQYVRSGSEQIPECPKMTVEQFMAICTAWPNYYPPPGMSNSFGSPKAPAWSGCSFDICSKRMHDSDVEARLPTRQWNDITEESYEQVLKFQFDQTYC